MKQSALAISQPSSLSTSSRIQRIIQAVVQQQKAIDRLMPGTVEFHLGKTKNDVMLKVSGHITLST